MRIRGPFAGAAILFACAIESTNSMATTVAQNDSVDLSTLQDNGNINACPCFCNYECFAATLTAPDDMQINYIYLLFGVDTGMTINTAFDFYILENPTSYSPGEPFVDDNDLEAVGKYLTFYSGSSQLLEISVLQSEVSPPTVAAGDKFSISFCYNYDENDELDQIEPNNGAGPAYDSDGVDGTNWVRATTGTCGDQNATFSWTKQGLPGDWVIRATDEPVDWLSGEGGSGGGGTTTSSSTSTTTTSTTTTTTTTSSSTDTTTSTGSGGSSTIGDVVVLDITPTFMNEGEPVTVAITGEGFDDSAQAFIGGLALSNVTVVSDQRIDAVAPQSITASDTPYDVTVNTSNGTSTLPGAFTVQGASSDDPQTDSGCNCSTTSSPLNMASWLGLIAPALYWARRRRAV